MSFQRFSFNYYSTIFSSIFDIVLVDAYFPCKKCLLAKKLFWELKNWYGHVFSKIKTKNFDENQKFRGTQTLNKFLLLAFIFPREINIMNDIICWSSKLHLEVITSTVQLTKIMSVRLFGSTQEDRYKVEHFHFLCNSSTICGTASQKCGTGPVNGSQFHKLWNRGPNWTF